jgi:hypothetical protein
MYNNYIYTYGRREISIGRASRGSVAAKVSWASVYDIMTQRVPLYPRVIITKGTATAATTTTTSEYWPPPRRLEHYTRVSG